MAGALKKTRSGNNTNKTLKIAKNALKKKKLPLRAASFFK